MGRMLCIALAGAGADIVMNYWRTEEDAQKTKTEIESLGRRCLAVEADVTDVRQISDMMGRVEMEFSRLDILVNNASNFNQCPFLEVTEEIWESSVGVNLKAPFFVSQAAAKLMLKNGSGRIIALVGNSYYENWPDFIPHAAAKTGHAKLMQSMAIALSPKIQCNAICPASVYPSEEGTYVMETRGEKLEDGYVNIGGLLLHKGTTEEVAELVVYLSGCSNYLTGAVIPLNGGKSVL